MKDDGKIDGLDESATTPADTPMTLTTYVEAFGRYAAVIANAESQPVTARMTISVQRRQP